MEKQRNKRRWLLEVKLASVCLAIIFLVIVAATSFTQGEEVKGMEVTNSGEKPVHPTTKADVVPIEMKDKQDVLGKKENKPLGKEQQVKPREGSPAPKVRAKPKQELPVKQLNKQTIYLTFDDGPNRYTDAIIDLLDQYHAKATFFMLQPNMNKFPDTIKRMVKGGHAVGMHGVTHNASIIYQSSQTVVNEMKTGQATLEAISGVYSHLIRVPYGSVPYMKPSYFEAVYTEGFKLWDWNVDSKDWKYHSEKYVLHVLDQLEAFSNEGKPKVVLLHDRKSTLENLDKLLRKLTELGYEMKPLAEQLEPVTL